MDLAAVTAVSLFGPTTVSEAVEAASACVCVVGCRAGPSAVTAKPGIAKHAATAVVIIAAGNRIFCFCFLDKRRAAAGGLI